ncbi:MAG: hypothetical protein JWN83_1256 [Chitinophagaceae bacterium]|nr:hypothetical protein [Chitinophagaceae bacterium]
MRKIFLWKRLIASMVITFFIGTINVHAQSTYVLGPLDGQNGWNGGSPCGTFVNSGTGDADVVNTVTHTGCQSWYYKHGYNSPGCGTPFSPVVASVGALQYSTQGNQSIIKLSFKAAALNDGSKINIYEGSVNRDDRTGANLYIENMADGTVQLFMFRSDDIDLSAQEIIGNYPANVWNTVEMITDYPVTNGSDRTTWGTTKYYVNGTLVFTETTWPHWYRYKLGYDYAPGSSIKFVTYTPSGDATRSGFYIDDVSMTVRNTITNTTIATFSTGFEPIGSNTYYPDTDGDGYGAGQGVAFCSATAPTGYSANNTDCDDNNVAVNTNCNLAANCSYSNDFSAPVFTGPTKASNVWYTDRYAPAGFASPATTPAPNNRPNTLKESISAANAQTTANAFYNTQGRIYDMGNATIYTEIMLYVPQSWASTGRRMAGFWATLFNSSNGIAGWPNIEFTSDGSKPRFTAYNNGAVMNMGLPTGFTYNSWIKLSMTLLANGNILYTAGNIQKTGGAYGTFKPVRLGNVILEGFNTPAGVNYDIYWDDFAYHCYAPCASGDVTMCYNGTTYCVKQKDVAKKQSQGYVLGECTTTTTSSITYSRTNIRTELIEAAINNVVNKPKAFTLSNFPNPFSTTTKIKFDVPVSGKVILKVYNTKGQAVATLFEGIKNPGSYTIDFDGSALGSGVYYCKLASADVLTVVTQKLVIIR